MSENNWITSNLNERLTNSLIDFEVQFNPTPFRYISFEAASNDVVKKISHINKNIYVSLSGGLDSEYILRTFLKNKIDVVPIVVVVSGTINNHKEIEFAYQACKELQIKPIVLECTDKMFIKIFIEEILNRTYGIGINIVGACLAQKYAKNHEGIILTGEHCIDDEPLITKGSMCEWDFSLETNTYGPLVYTPEIFYAIVKQFDNTPIQQFKSKLYKLKYREKMKPNIIPKTRDIINTIILSRTNFNVKRIYQLGTKDQILKYMEKWND